MNNTRTQMLPDDWKNTEINSDVDILLAIGTGKIEV